MAANSVLRAAVRSRVGSGFDLHPIQRSAAIATPGKWRDALVTEVFATGDIQLQHVEDGHARIIWHYQDLTSTLKPGDPVAVHADYDVLAAGGTHYSIRV